MIDEMRVLKIEENEIKELGDYVKKMRMEEFYVKEKNIKKLEVNDERMRVMNL
jgi:hypothetical protein